MIITGIEVIRGNHRASPRGGNPGQATEVLPGGKVELTYGDRLHVNTGLDYKGSKLDATLYGAIGIRGATFDEKVFGEADVTFPKADTFTPWLGSVDIPITADIDPGADYDLYCKIKEYPGAGMPKVDNVITITGIPPTFELLEETIYPYAYIYEGPCDIASATFRTAPFTPSSWVAGILAGHVENKVRKAGGRIMEMRVYVDKSPLLWTDWLIEFVTTSPTATAGTAMSLGAWWLGPAIILALLIILLIVGMIAWKLVSGTFKRNPALKDVKPAWKKETLILTIQDAEEYWKRTPTPVETLQGMSEEELRDYLDKIAEEEVVPPVEGLGLAIAAVGILALGALALGAYAMGKPREAGKK